MGTQEYIYIYNPETYLFEYIHRAQRDPLNPGYYLYPPHNCLIQPPDVDEFHIQKWSPQNQEWIIIPDYSKKIVYNKLTGETINLEPGDTLNENQTINFDEVNENIRRIPLEENLKNKIISYFNDINEKGILFKNHQFQSRLEDINKINLMLMKQQLGGNVYNYWRDRDNNWINLNFEELRELALLMGNYWEDNFIKSRKLIDNLKLINILQLKELNIFDYINTLL